MERQGAALLEAELVLATPDDKTARGGPVVRQDREHQGSRARRPSPASCRPRNPAHARRTTRSSSALTQVRGIGRWTVEMMLMSRLGRPDVLPIDDFGVRNGFRLAYGLRGMPTTRALAEFGARWAPLSLGGGVVPVARGGPASRGQTTRAGHADAHQAREEESREEEGAQRRRRKRSAHRRAKRAKQAASRQ